MASKVTNSNFMDAKFQSIFKELRSKLHEILKDNKANVTELCRDLVQLFLQGVNPQILHNSFKVELIQFLKQILPSYSDVRSLQSGLGYKEKLLLLMIIKLIYADKGDVSVDDLIGGKRMLYFMSQISQRLLNFDVDVLGNMVFQGCTGYEINTGIPKMSVLLIPSTLEGKKDGECETWPTINAGELSKKLGLWLLIHPNQAISTEKKKRLGVKHPNVPTSSEIDGSTTRDIFTILCINSSYHHEMLLNIYCFSILKPWLQFLHGKEDCSDLLALQLGKLTGRDHSVAGSPVQIGGSKFYDEHSSGSDSTGGYSLSSSVSDLHSFMYVDDVNDALDLRRASPLTVDSRQHIPFRKSSQAYDTMSITSDILVNASNLKSVAIRYCLRVIGQSEKSPRHEYDRKLVTASVVECVEILDLLASDESNFNQKIFNEIKRLYHRIEHNPFTARRVYVALLHFFIHHHEAMLLQIDDILDAYFKTVGNHVANQTVVFELIDLVQRNEHFFQNKTNVLRKYYPNVFKMVAWWPCTFLYDFFDLMDLFISSVNASEMFHSILDLPCVIALLTLQMEGVLDNQGSLIKVLNIETTKPYFPAMFAFMLRATSGGAETIDKLQELHILLASVKNKPRVKFCSDIVVPLLMCFFTAIENLDDSNVFREIFPVILERVYMLYTTNELQEEIHDILAEQILKIPAIVPNIINFYCEEIITFLSQISAMKLTSVSLVSNTIWCIGESVSDASCESQKVLSLYDHIEMMLYEYAHQMGQTDSILANPEVISTAISTLSKLAAFVQERIPRAIVCLNKITQIENDSCKNVSLVNFKAVITYAEEMIQILRKPKVAPMILCNTCKTVPWHVDANQSLLLKVHLLTAKKEEHR